MRSMKYASMRHFILLSFWLLHLTDILRLGTLSFIHRSDIANIQVILKSNWDDEAIVCTRKATVDDLLTMKVCNLFAYLRNTRWNTTNMWHTNVTTTSPLQYSASSASHCKFRLISRRTRSTQNIMEAAQTSSPPPL